MRNLILDLVHKLHENKCYHKMIFLIVLENGMTMNSRITKEGFGVIDFRLNHKLMYRTDFENIKELNYKEIYEEITERLEL